MLRLFVRWLLILASCVLLFILTDHSINNNASDMYSKQGKNEPDGLLVPDKLRSKSLKDKDRQITTTNILEAKRHCNHSQYIKRLPSAIIIGEQKCSTAAILDFLCLVNPKIHAAEMETHFFDQKKNLTEEDFEYYKTMMPLSCPLDITMEKTPSYFHNEHTPRQMFKWNPDLKLILTLCDPVDRAVSQYYFILRNIQAGCDWAQEYMHYANSTFDNLAITENGTVNETFSPLIRSLYDISMEYWIKVFPLTQIHIADADHFSKSNPAFELKKIEKFLGMEPKSKEEMFWFKKEKHFYCFQGHGCFGKEKGHQHKPLAEKTQRVLYKFFAPHVHKLKTMIGPSLSWMPKYLNGSIQNTK